MELTGFDSVKSFVRSTTTMHRIIITLTGLFFTVLISSPHPPSSCLPWQQFHVLSSMDQQSVQQRLTYKYCSKQTYTMLQNLEAGSCVAFLSTLVLLLFCENVERSCVEWLYNVTGELLSTVEMTHGVLPWNAISCNDHYIFLAENHPAALHVYTWSGSHVTKLSAHQLGLQENDRIRAVQCLPAQQSLLLAVGDRRYGLGYVRVSSFRGFLVSDRCVLA